MQELLKPQLEMMERRIAELREQGKQELADRLAEKFGKRFRRIRQVQQVSADNVVSRQRSRDRRTPRARAAGSR